MSNNGQSDDQITSPPRTEDLTAQDTGYTFTDDPWIRWRNTWRYLTGSLTEEGVRQYHRGRNDRMEESDCRRCEQDRDYLLQYSMNMTISMKEASLIIYQALSYVF